MSGFMAFDHDTPMEYARKALNMDWSFQFNSCIQNLKLNFASSEVMKIMN